MMPYYLTGASLTSVIIDLSKVYILSMLFFLDFYCKIMITEQDNPDEQPQEYDEPIIAANLEEAERICRISHETA